MYEEELIKERKKIEDFEILKSIVQGNIKINELEKDLKIRLIELCDLRLKKINLDIERIKKEIKSL